MTLELLDPSGDIKEENEDIKIRYTQFSGSLTYRLGFF